MNKLGTLGLLITTMALNPEIAPSSALAEIVPDATLPNNSIVNLEGQIQHITGGTEAGNNLFHSFDRFNVITGETAYFDNALNLENIVTRITGGKISTIDGLIRANGTANLFLINPNGIVFGENARLEIGGSFFGSTAESLVFADGSFYSATEPNAPPLLTIDVPIGLQYGANYQGNISNAGNLAVGASQTLGLGGNHMTNTGLLMGGTVRVTSDNITIGDGGTMSGGALSASLAAGNVVLQSQNDINIEDNVTAGAGNALSLQAGRSISILGDRTLSLNGGNFTAHIDDESANPTRRDSGVAQFVINPGSQLLTEGGNVSIESGTSGSTVNMVSSRIDTWSSVGNPGGNVTILATGDATLGNIDTSVRIGSQKAGDITVISQEGAISTFGLLNVEVFEHTGIAGDVFLQAAGDLSVNSILASGSPGGAITLISGDRFQQLGNENSIQSETFGNGTGKDVTISAASVFLRDGIFVQTWDALDGGNLTVNASEEIVLSERAEVTTTTFGSGNAGDITFNTPRLTIREILNLDPPDAGIGSSTDPNTSGNGGNVTLNVSESIDLIGNQPGAVTPDLDRLSAAPLLVNAGIFAFSLGTGKTGDIMVNTHRLTIRNGAGISTSPGVLAEGGNITIQASDILLQGLGGIGTTTLGFGNAGDLTIDSDLIVLSDGAVLVTDTLPITRSILDLLITVDTIDQSTRNLLEAIGNSGTGDAGDLTIQTRELSIRNGSTIGAATSTQGDGGRLSIQATDSITVTGRTVDGTLPSSIFSGVRFFPDAPTRGNGGNVEISTHQLHLDAGGTISAATLSEGNSGNVEIDANHFALDQGSQVSVSGRGGNLTVNADILRLDDSILSADTQMGDRGNITLNTQDLQLRHGSLITTNATGVATGGKITLDTTTLTALENSDISANSRDAQGGNITINTQGIFGTEFRLFPTSESDITATGGNPNLSGRVQLNTPEIDTTSGLVEFSQDAVNVDRLLAQNPCRNTRDNAFTITGRNGLPNDPRNFLSGETLWEDWRIAESSPSTGTSSIETSSLLPLSKDMNAQGDPLVEAQGWIQHPDGTIELVAHSSTSPQHFGTRTPNCGEF